jgi:hypothetical protein
MNIKLLTVMAIVLIVSACAEHSCPTYGSHYTYSPPRKKVFNFGNSASRKPVKKAEQP